MTIKLCISAQTKEWYGDQEPGVGQGRWKNKGGHDFILEMDDAAYMSTSDEELKAKFNEAFDSADSYMRYEALDVKVHWEPSEIVLVDGKFSYPTA
tara:strand:- start:1633 stop:1920 length:288 start_codon:yes stop_codon:yes gene_type:complete